MAVPTLDEVRRALSLRPPELLPVRLPRPRDPSSSEFGALSRRLTGLVMEEQARHERDERGGTLYL